jgi:hypothetical protein
MLGPMAKDGNAVHGVPTKDCKAHTVYVKKSSIRTDEGKSVGYGLFACQYIPADTIFMMYQGVYYTKEQLKKTWPDFKERKYHMDYMIHIGNGNLYIDAADPRFSSMARFANDCHKGDTIKKEQCGVNAIFTEYNANNVFLEALRDIQQNEEILISYGDDYWFEGKRVSNNHPEDRVVTIKNGAPSEALVEFKEDENITLPSRPKKKITKRARTENQLPLHEQAVFRVLLLLERVDPSFRIRPASFARVAFEFFAGTGTDEEEKENWQKFKTSSAAVKRGMQNLVNKENIASKLDVSKTVVLYSLRENAKNTLFYKKWAKLVQQKFVLVNEEDAIATLRTRFIDHKYVDPAKAKHKKKRQAQIKKVNQDNAKRKKQQSQEKQPQLQRLQQQGAVAMPNHGLSNQVVGFPSGAIRSSPDFGTSGTANFSKNLGDSGDSIFPLLNHSPGAIGNGKLDFNPNWDLNFRPLDNSQDGASSNSQGGRTGFQDPRLGPLASQYGHQGNQQHSSSMFAPLSFHPNNAPMVGPVPSGTGMTTISMFSSVAPNNAASALFSQNYHMGSPSSSFLHPDTLDAHKHSSSMLGSSELYHSF